MPKVRVRRFIPSFIPSVALLLVVGCGASGNDDPETGGASSGASGNDNSGSGGASSSGNAGSAQGQAGNSGTAIATAGSGGMTVTAGAGGTSSAGGSSNGGAAGSAGKGGGGAAGSTGAGGAFMGPKPVPCDQLGDGGAQDIGKTGVWTNVTPQALDGGEFGPGLIFVDPGVPSNLYVGGGHGGFWKSTDYGLTWSQTSNIDGHFTFNIARTKADGPPVFYTSPGNGSGSMLRSIDEGKTWTTIGSVGTSYDPYSVTVDPYDPTHLLTGLHESGGIYESTNSGDTWKKSPGFPSGGISWYPFFIDTGSAATTRKTWIALGQNDVGTERTTDGGATWTNVQKLQHPHGNSQIYQYQNALYIAGIGGSNGGGVYRSEDLGATFTHVGADTNGTVVFGTPSHVYMLYGWAATGEVPNNFQLAPQPGKTNWMSVSAPMKQGANKVAVTCAGGHYILVGQMWWTGIWRYIEP